MEELKKKMKKKKEKKRLVEYYVFVGEIIFHHTLGFFFGKCSNLKL